MEINELNQALNLIFIDYMVFQKRNNVEEIKGLMPEIQDFVLWFLEGNKLGIEDELYWDMKRNLLDIIKDMAEALEKNDGVLLHDATAYGLSKYLELFLPEVEKE